jgi:release factor glutamine methyltransferase
MNAEAPATATINEALRNAAACLRPVTDNPRLEARLLLAHALGITQNDLLRDPARPIETTSFNALIARRLQREPVALIVGHKGFWTMDLQVSNATLVPRADSETLIQAALARFQHHEPPQRILDLGTGTGCLLLALLDVFPAAEGVGVDLVPAAARLARTNSRLVGLDHRAVFACGGWADAIDGRFDLIVANPPYIPTADIDALMPDVALYEPRTALDGGADGLDAYRVIIPRLPHLLTGSGAAVLELGIRQAGPVVQLAASWGLRSSLHRDLGGIERAIVLDSALE